MTNEKTNPASTALNPLLTFFLLVGANFLLAIIGALAINLLFTPQESILNTSRIGLMATIVFAPMFLAQALLYKVAVSFSTSQPSAPATKVTPVAEESEEENLVQFNVALSEINASLLGIADSIGRINRQASINLAELQATHEILAESNALASVNNTEEALIA